MNGRDGMRNGQEPSAVRVLPPDGTRPVTTESPTTQGRGPRRSWAMPVALLAGTLALFFLATLSSSGDIQAAPTTAPPTISAADTGLVSMTDAADDGTTNGWEKVSFEPSAQIAGLTTLNNSFIAYGRTGTTAAVWLAGRGDYWRPVTQIELPEATRSSIDHVVSWNGDVVALGSVDDATGLWLGRTASQWRYQGEIPGVGSQGLIGLVTGPELLAIQDRGGNSNDMFGWTSADGLEWTSTGPLQGVDGLGFALALAGDEAGYYLGGEAACDEGRCEPVIYRSTDGANWERAELDLPGIVDEQAGTVLDIATSGDRLFAVGLLGPFPSVEVAVWGSSDGFSWARVGADEPSFSPPSVGVELVSVDDDGSASILVNGTRHDAGIDTEVTTDVGDFTITDVDENRLLLTYDDGVHRLGIGGRLDLERAITAGHIAVQGERIVIAGALVGVGTRTPVVWSSVDGGQSWERAVAPEDGMAVDVSVAGRNIAVSSWDEEARTSFWHAGWNTSEAEGRGISQLTDYVNALNERDIETLAALLPTDLRTSPRPSFQVPSLGATKHSWWDQDRGTLRLDLVQETLDYLEAMHTTITITECSANLRLGAIDDLRATCDVEVRSDLMAALEIPPEEAELEALYGAEGLQVVNATAMSSTRMWGALAARSSSAAAIDQATLVQPDLQGGRLLQPTFTADTAAAHMRLAALFVEGLLQPGETKIIETPLGTMEWQWLDEMPAPVHMFNLIVHTPSGFVAAADLVPNAESQQVSLWSSPDGLTWTEAFSPDGIDWIWNITPFRSGLVAEGWAEPEGPMLLLLDGDEWSTLPIPHDGDNDQFGLSGLAASGDQLLVLADEWGQRGLSGRTGWLLDDGNVFRRVELPEEAAAVDNMVGLVGGEDGFTFATSQDGRGLAMWHSVDGDEWELISDMDSVDDARYAWNLQRHGTKYFIVGEGAEDLCGTDAEGQTFCQPAIGLWSSSDGVNWDGVDTALGEPVTAFEIGSGPLGLVAVGQAPFSEPPTPSSVFFSPDAEVWEQAGNLALFDAAAGWWWISEPAVGESSIVLTGMAGPNPLSSFDSPEEPFMIVGRLLP